MDCKAAWENDAELRARDLIEEEEKAQREIVKRVAHTKSQAKNVKGRILKNNTLSREAVVSIPEKVLTTEEVSKAATEKEGIFEDFLIEGQSRVVGKITYSEEFCIGEGSLGTKVFVGVHNEYGNAAIKIFPKRSKSKQRENLLTELREMERNMLLLISRSGRHKNVVEYLGFEEDEDFFYLALELCDFSLHAVFAQDNMIEVRSSLREPPRQKQIVSQLLNGLAFLHGLQIVHADIRPKNVLFDINYRVKIADFGLASKVAYEDDSFTWETSPDGVGGWFAPEVYLHGRKTKAVDLFSTGCVIFWILSDGVHPFNNNPFRVVQGNYDGSALMHLPEAYDLCGWMMDADGAHRPTAAEAQQHPYLWCEQQRMLYIQDIGNKIDQLRDTIETSMVWMRPDTLQKASSSSPSLDRSRRWKLEASSYNLNAELQVKLSWKEYISADLIESLSRFSMLLALHAVYCFSRIILFYTMSPFRRRKYEGTSSVDLLRVFRNLDQHFHDQTDLAILSLYVPLPSNSPSSSLASSSNSSSTDDSVDVIRWLSEVMSRSSMQREVISAFMSSVFPVLILSLWKPIRGYCGADLTESS